MKCCNHVQDVEGIDSDSNDEHATPMMQEDPCFPAGIYCSHHLQLLVLRMTHRLTLHVPYCTMLFGLIAICIIEAHSTRACHEKLLRQYSVFSQLILETISGLVQVTQQACLNKA